MNLSLVIFYCFEAMPVIAGLIYWKNVKNSYFKWFVAYLTYTVVADLSGITMVFLKIHNQVFYEYFVIPVEFLFFFWLFFKSLISAKHKRLPAICAGIYLSGLLIDAVYFARHHLHFYSFSYSIGNLLLLILILQFFIQLISSDELLKYRSNMMFWISTGLLVFYLGSCPYYGLTNTFIAKYYKVFVIYKNIVLALDCIMYLMFTFSFIWGKPNLRSSR